ncbi:VOC family protein [Streptomyces broussonetiae]|uniref:VOC family protein n=1 Tax=Streptomyces broussonetiae TaxID=2686304 RepID=A0A6I6NA92_9ACTN|nr:VOC family protein [Streptomyces broussonetiae]QHA05865.1 VOC family protein [Streptomyces broussonetiae]
MLGTEFHTGSPVWLDVASPDPDRTAAFYGAVFGWRFTSAGPDAGGYGYLQKDGATVAAVGRLTEQGARPAWMTYFRADDVQAAAGTVTSAGGTVRVAPMTMGEASMAQFTDPQGAQFAVLRSGQGLQRTSQDDSLVWVELHTGDPESAVGFYHRLFGWRSAEMKAPGMTYRVLSIAAGDQQEGSFGGVAPLQDSPQARWMPYFAVADVDATATAVQDNGGTVLMPPSDLPDVGRVAWLTDPTQAAFAVLKPNPRGTAQA